MVPHSMVQVIADYSPTEPGGLSMRKGELATLVELKEQGWCVVKIAAGARGYFPLSYLQPAPPDPVRAPSAAPVTATAPAAPAPGAKPLVAAAPQYRSDGGWESFSGCPSTRSLKSRQIAPPPLALSSSGVSICTFLLVKQVNEYLARHRMSKKLMWEMWEADQRGCVGMLTYADVC